MLPENDEEWLRQIALGAGELEKEVAPTPISPPRPELSVGNEGQVGATANSPLVNIESDAEDAQPLTVLDTRGRQRALVAAVGTPDGRPPLGAGQKRGASAGVEVQQKKKQKAQHASSSMTSGATGRYRSFALDKEFVLKTREEYYADPIAAAIHTMTHLQDIANAERQKNELRVQEVEKRLAQAIEQKRLAAVTLATVRTSLQIVEKQRDDLTLERNQAETRAEELEEKIGGLEKRIRELCQSEEEAEAKIEQLSSKVEELERSLKDAASNENSSAKIAELEKKLAESEGRRARSEETAKKTAQLALQMKDRGFNLALDQVMVVNPSLGSMSAVLKPDHLVEDGKIVKVDPSTKMKSVVYNPNRS